MKKRLLCGFLCLGLCLGSVQAAEGGFSDVKDSDWFAPYVSVCVENGLMNGTGKGNFSPDGTITVAECAAIAARLRETLTGEPIPGVTPVPGETLPWYQQYVSYLTANAVAVPDPVKIATRAQLFSLLAAVTTEELLTPINQIDSLPDVNAGDPVLDFYNAGILTGVDEYGTFAGDKTLTRAEVAAMMARLVDSSLRKAGVVPPSPGLAPEEPSPSADDKVAMTVNGQPVTLSDLEGWVAAVAYQADMNFATQYGSRLDFSHADIARAVLEQAQLQAAAQALMKLQADRMGCEVDSLPTALAPSPTREELQTYVNDHGLLSAKHILVADLESAQAVLNGLEAQPTLEQFDALLTVFGTDPGMTANPDGYLFGPGEMVTEFEEGTKALEIGSYSSEPVRSTYGYHIIWRLDPLDHPDLLSGYRSDILEQYVNRWLREAEISTDSQVVSQLDVAATYAAYLQALLGSQ